MGSGALQRLARRCSSSVPEREPCNKSWNSGKVSPKLGQIRSNSPKLAESG